MIYVDKHEPKDIVDLIEEYGYNTEVISLSIGDYTWGEYVIERKTTKDFLNTLFSGRLWNQVYDMMVNYKHPILILEGGFVYPWTRSDWKKMVAMISAIARIVAKFNISVVTTQDNKMTASLICSIYKASESKGGLKPVKKKGHTISEIKENILTCIPGIGRSTAKSILAEYKSIKNIIDTDISSLSSIKRVSKDTAKRILHIFTSTE